MVVSKVQETKNWNSLKVEEIAIEDVKEHIAAAARSCSGGSSWLGFYGYFMNNE